jgi:hypothetical protein
VGLDVVVYGFTIFRRWLGLSLLSNLDHGLALVFAEMDVRPLHFESSQVFADGPPFLKLIGSIFPPSTNVFSVIFPALIRRREDE